MEQVVRAPEKSTGTGFTKREYCIDCKEHLRATKDGYCFRCYAWKFSTLRRKRRKAAKKYRDRT
jgi:hypothetical protein